MIRFTVLYGTHGSNCFRTRIADVYTVNNDENFELYPSSSEKDFLRFAQLNVSPPLQEEKKEDRVAASERRIMHHTPDALVLLLFVFSSSLSWRRASLRRFVERWSFGR